MSSFWYSTYYLKRYIYWTGNTGIFLPSLRHACSCSTPKWFTHSQRVDAHIPSPNSLPTHRQAHTSHVQWSLETCSSVCLCVCLCVCVCGPLFTPRWMETHCMAESHEPSWHIAWEEGRNNSGNTQKMDNNTEDGGHWWQKVLVQV